MMKLASVFLIFIYMIIPVLLFGHMTHMIDSQMMGHQDCTFLVGSDSVCPMSFPAHLGILQNVIVVPLFYKLLILCSSVIFFGFIYVSLNIIKSSFYFKRKRYRDIPLLFQELFSQGILNGKAF
ncbi:MAG: hypothetical protein WCO65_03140 [bacterium]